MTYFRRASRPKRMLVCERRRREQENFGDFHLTSEKDALMCTQNVQNAHGSQNAPTSPTKKLLIFWRAFRLKEYLSLRAPKARAEKFWDFRFESLKKMHKYVLNTYKTHAEVKMRQNHPFKNRSFSARISTKRES